MSRLCQDILFGDAACNAQDKSLHVRSQYRLWGSP